MIYLLLGLLILLWVLAPLKRRREPLMVPAKAVLVGLALIGIAWAQGVVAVEPGWSISPLMILILVLAGGGVGLYIWHRKNPVGSSKALLEAQADLSKLTAQVSDVIPKLVATIEQQVHTIAATVTPTQQAVSTLKRMGASDQALANVIATHDPAGEEQIDKETLAVARAYRVAFASFGGTDPRTIHYLNLLAGMPHWSDALAYAGGSGFDSLAEEAIAAQMKA